MLEWWIYYSEIRETTFLTTCSTPLVFEAPVRPDLFLPLASLSPYARGHLQHNYYKFNKKSKTADHGCWCGEALIREEGCQAVRHSLPLQEHHVGFCSSLPWEQLHHCAKNDFSSRDNRDSTGASNHSLPSLSVHLHLDVLARHVVLDELPGLALLATHSPHYHLGVRSVLKAGDPTESRIHISDYVGFGITVLRCFI